MRSSYAALDHHGNCEKQRRLDQVSRNRSQGRGLQEYMATSHTRLAEPQSGMLDKPVRDRGSG